MFLGTTNHVHVARMGGVVCLHNSNVLLDLLFVSTTASGSSVSRFHNGLTVTLSDDKQRLCLYRKGVCFSLSHGDLSNAEWVRWIDPNSPNAKLLWRSLLPALVAKSLWYAGNSEDVVANFRSLIWGLTIRGYPTRWWTPVFWRLYDRHIPSRFFPRHQVRDSCKQGKACVST